MSSMLQINKEVTIYDIADKLNISAATVSRALTNHPRISKKTKKKIFELAEQIGYRQNHFAQNLRTQKTNTIGIIVPSLSSNFMSSVIEGIENVASKEGYNLIISHSSESMEKEAGGLKSLFKNRVDGLLASLACDTTNLNHFDLFFRKNIPVVFFDRLLDHKDSINILIDNRKAAYEATKHLIEQGCKRIVHITAAPKQNVYIDRLKGYKQALTDHKIKFKEEYIIIGNLSMEAGNDAADVILKMKILPDGVFVANDSCAIGCMLALKQKGIKIPEDIAFVGFNNDPVSTVIEPNLTTVNYSGNEVGEVAVRHLINHLNGNTTMRKTASVMINHEFIVRASSLKKR